MILTWKRWTVFFIMAILAFFACQFYAETNLVDFVSSQNCETEYSAELPGSFQKFKNLIQNVQCATHLPWPIEFGIVSQEPRHFDPDQSQNIDAETLMGLAILGPNYCHDEACNHSHEEHQKHIADWFLKVSRLAIDRATDPKEKSNIARFRTFVVSNPNVFDNGQLLLDWQASKIHWTTTQEANGKSVPAFWEQIAVLGGHSRYLIYAYYRFYKEMMSIEFRGGKINASSPLPSRKMAELFSLAKEVDATSLANKIQVGIEFMSFPIFDKLNLYNTDRLRYVQKAMAYYWGRNIEFRTLIENDLAKQAMMSHIDQMRDMTNRLCFLGDQLVAKGENEKALWIYHFAYTIGEQMMICDGRQASYIQVEMGRTLTSGVAEHLMEFWARQGNAEKTMRVKELLDSNQILIKQEISKLAQKESDPLGYYPRTYETYARSASLTWWLGTTGLVFAIASLISVAVYILLARGRSLANNEKLEISYKLLELGFGVPIFLMILLTMIIPLKLGNEYITGSLLTWMWFFILLWLIFVGLLALFSSSATEGIRRSPGRRIWIFTALGVAAGCLVSSIISVDMMPVIAVGLGALVIGAGFFIWLVVIMITWMVQRSPEDRRSRARANLAFAVCSMLASAVFLLASLASMPLTRYHQDRYFNTAITNETGYFLGDNWPATFKGLPNAIFKVEK